VRVLVAHSDRRPFEVDRFGSAWRRAGGGESELVFVAPATAGAVAPPGAAFDGLLLTGGPDVDPRRFGAAPEPGVRLRLDPGRDALDLALLGRADAAGWPVLAVCYGMQILNVYHGGTVIQDLDHAGRRGHAISEPKDHLAHVVRRTGGGCRLATLPLEFLVNSRHHQAVGRPAADLEVVASAPDGVVEAVELRGSERFVLGVQWHPENLAEPEHVAIIRAFRQACLSFSAEPGARSPAPGAR
jgi:putative glutamine amidotransferase